MMELLRNTSTPNLLFAIVVGFLLLVVLLQALVQRSVWWVYLWGIPLVLVIWVLYNRVLT